jgi:hypothetical protein
MANALAGMQQLAGPGVPAGVAGDLAVAVKHWLASAGKMAQCLKVDLCVFSLVELDRLTENVRRDSLVEELLDRHYANAPLLPSTSAAEACDDDGRLAWRRERILYLLEGHPAPLDKIATVRLMGQTVADRIRDLQPRRRVDPLAGWRRAARMYRRARFRYRSQQWPAQLQAAFPYEYLGHGPSARSRLGELRAHVAPDQWARMQPPTDPELQIVRRRLRLMPNPLGVLLADALLATDISAQEQLRRQRLITTLARIGS